MAESLKAIVSEKVASIPFMLSERDAVGEVASCTLLKAPSRRTMWEEKRVLQRFVMVTVDWDKRGATVTVVPNDDRTRVNGGAVCSMEHGSEVTLSRDVGQLQCSQLF